MITVKIVKKQAFDGLFCREVVNYTQSGRKPRKTPENNKINP